MTDAGLHSVSLADHEAVTGFVLQAMEDVMREVNNAQELLITIDWVGDNSDAFEQKMMGEGEQFHTFNYREANRTLDNIIGAMNDLSRKLNNNVAMFGDVDVPNHALSQARSQKIEGTTKVSEAALEQFMEDIILRYDAVIAAWQNFQVMANQHTQWKGLARDAVIEVINADVPLIVNGQGGEGGIVSFKTSLVTYITEQLEIVRRPINTGGGGGGNYQ